MTREIYLEMTYRRGKPLAGYIYLPRQDGDKAFRSKKVGVGLVVDYASDGRPIGVEITSPTSVSLRAINELLVSLRQRTLTEAEIAPLLEGKQYVTEQAPPLFGIRPCHLAGEKTLPSLYSEILSTWITQCSTVTLPDSSSGTDELPGLADAMLVRSAHH